MNIMLKGYALSSCNRNYVVAEQMLMILPRTCSIVGNVPQDPVFDQHYKKYQQKYRAVAVEFV